MQGWKGWMGWTGRDGTKFSFLITFEIKSGKIKKYEAF